VTETDVRATGATEPRNVIADELVLQGAQRDRPHIRPDGVIDPYGLSADDIIAALEAAGYRIVRESAVLTEAEREALNGRITAWDRQFRQGAELVYLDKYSLELLRRLVERGGEPT
jgi:hypothetical protein